MPGREGKMIRVLADAEEVARAAANLFAEKAEAALSNGSRFSVVLSGGQTPRRALELISETDIDWSRVHIFWGDERCVPPDDPKSNYRMARESLLDHIPIPIANIHRVLGEK